MDGVDYIFHAAALKQVPSCEFFPMEAVKTNIIGTDNVLTAAIEEGVEAVICLSTDKAAYPINAMGKSKSLEESVAIAKSRYSGKTKICCTRYGNVMCSRGSVIPLWIDQIKAGNPITVTEPNMTRFIMSLEEAVDLVLYAFEHGENGDLLIMKAPACSIGLQAEAVCEMFGGNKDDIKVIGIRHGEKMYETLLTNEECATVNDRSTELEVLYISYNKEHYMFDQQHQRNNTVLFCRLDLLEGKEQHCEFDGVETVLSENGRYCCVSVTHKVTLGEIVDLLEEFKAQPVSLMMPKCPEGSFAKKLFSLYLTYLPADKFKYAMKMNCDDRGSFTELVHTVDCGQVSINISKPGITKGQHWHNSKWEQFIVVHGHGLIQERNINTGETVEFEVSGDKIEAIYMIPGWTHNIINLSETDDLVTVMTCNEIFDPGHPDTFFEPV